MKFGRYGYVLTGLMVGLFSVLIGGVAKEAAAQSQEGVKTMPKLGLAVSRPALTYVQISEEIHAAVIVGCGDDNDADRAAQQNDDAPGRCVLVLKASDGSVLRRFDTGNGISGAARMSYPMNGAVTVYPSTGVLPAERGYIGDRVGRVWRIDLRSNNPNNWSMAIAWPPRDEDERGGYTVGRTVVDRATVGLQSSGKLAVVFGTGDKTLPDAGRAHVVSFTDEAVLGDEEQMNYQVRKNWVLPLREKEYVSGPPVVRSKVAFFTSIQTGQANVCDQGLGRLYGVHYNRTSEPYGTADGRTLDVVPALPSLVTDRGVRVTDAMALQLPIGKVAYGLAIMTTPSCVEDEDAITEVILNLSQGKGASGTAGGATRIERKTGQVVPGKLDDDFINEGRNDVAIQMKNIEQVGAAEGAITGPRAPFPRQILYWGSSFSQ